MHAVRRIAGDEDCHPAQHEAKHVSDGDGELLGAAATAASSEVNKLVWLSEACPSCSSALIVHRRSSFLSLSSSSGQEISEEPGLGIRFGLFGLSKLRFPAMNTRSVISKMQNRRVRFQFPNSAFRFKPR